MSTNWIGTNPSNPLTPQVWTNTATGQKVFGKAAGMGNPADGIVLYDQTSGQRTGQIIDNAGHSAAPHTLDTTAIKAAALSAGLLTGGLATGVIGGGATAGGEIAAGAGAAKKGLSALDSGAPSVSNDVVDTGTSGVGDIMGGGSTSSGGGNLGKVAGLFSGGNQSPLQTLVGIGSGIAGDVLSNQQSNASRALQQQQLKQQNDQFLAQQAQQAAQFGQTFGQTQAQAGLNAQQQNPYTQENQRAAQAVFGAMASGGYTPRTYDQAKGQFVGGPDMAALMKAAAPFLTQGATGAAQGAFDQNARNADPKYASVNPAAAGFNASGQAGYAVPGGTTDGTFSGNLPGLASTLAANPAANAAPPAVNAPPSPINVSPTTSLSGSMGAPGSNLPTPTSAGPLSASVASPFSGAASQLGTGTLAGLAANGAANGGATLSPLQQVAAKLAAQKQSAGVN